MQKPNLNPPIKSVCTTPFGASASNPVFIVRTYYNSATNEWYRKYSDGVIEQGGYRTDLPITRGEVSFDFILPYQTANACVRITPVFNETPSGSTRNGGIAVKSVTTTNCTIYHDLPTTLTIGYYWETRGL
ncbi:MAG: hypothetical protein IJG38_07615 [Thermoguttaceae bacterium]|nr:hypothetical protein [Thermoguttaceae bacterium]